MQIQEIFDLKGMHAAYKNKDINTLLSFYAQEAKIVQVIVKTGQKNIFTGHKEIRGTYTELFADISDYEYFDENVIIVGNTALFTFQWALLINGKRGEANFASWVLQKDVNAKWCITIDTYRC